MNETGRELIERLHREAAARIEDRPVMPTEPPTIHYSELPEAPQESPLHEEWNVYRREAGRLLAEGNAGRYVLISGDSIIGIWDSKEEAFKAGYERYLGRAFLVHQVQERERIIRCLSVFPCPGTLTPFKQAS